MQRVVSKSVSKSLLTSVLTSVFALVFVAGVASAKQREKVATVDIAQSAQVLNGPTLQPGTYQVKLLGESGNSQVAFYQGGKLVAQAPATLVDQGTKSTETAAHFNDANGNHVLTQIDVDGWTKSIQFGPSAGASGSAQ